MKPTVHTICPAEIRWAMIDFEFDTAKYLEGVVPGDWDQRLARFELAISGTLFRSLQQKDQGVIWENTEYWRFLEDSLRRGVVHCGVRNRKELQKRCYGFIDTLVAETRREGRIPAKYNEKDFVGVSVARDGRIVLNNGRHRLGVAAYLKLASLPIVVNVRHAQWVGFKESIRNYAVKHAGVIYAPCRHFDLRDFKSCYSGRIEMIYDHIDSNRLHSVLDVGAAWGSHSIYLSQRGLACTAVESNLQAVGFLRKLTKASECAIDIIPQSIFEVPRKPYDIVLALRIFHHFLKTEKQYNALKGFLQKLDVKELYFQPHDVTVQRMPGAYRNLGTYAFVRFILDNSTFTRSDQIGKTEGGPIVRFSR